MNTVTIIILILVIILVIIFLLKKKVLTFTSNLPNILFPIFLLITLISLFMFSPFLEFSDYTYQKTGIFSTIKNMDQAIYEISPENLLDKAKQKTDNLMDKVSNWLKKDEEKQKENQNNISEAEDKEIERKGILETELYPKLVLVLAVVYKVLFILLGILGLVLCIYFSYSMESLRENASLRKKYNRLKERVVRLEEKTSIKEEY